MTGIVDLSEQFIEHQLLTQEQLNNALSVQSSAGKDLNDVIVELGYLPADLLDAFINKRLKIPIVNLRNYPLDSSLVNKLPERQALRLQAIVLQQSGMELLVGVTNPSDILIQDELARILNQPIKIALVNKEDLFESIKKIYRRIEQIDAYAEELSTALHTQAYDLKIQDQGDVPVARLLKSIFEDAMRINATDIHLEPEEHLLRIRQRVDGLLQEHIVRDTHIVMALTQRLKLMANLDIAERRLPQDGAFSLKLEGEIIEVRLSTIPSQYGESVAMRLLKHSNVLLDLEQLGLSAGTLKILRKNIFRPYGLILITGPTGSGKTTSLYGMLSEINSVDKKIITVEDPVEYKLERINQVQVNAKIELTFARILRSVLRQDPDIIMIGEIRDYETAEIALRASLTGHLVFATLHTNDAISAVIRLIDMGAQSYLISAALRSVMAQRLVRLICDRCAESYVISDEDKNRLVALCQDDKILPGGKLFRGKGCTHCMHTGHHGRVSVSEILELNSEMISALRANDQEAYIHLAKERMHNHLLIHNAMALAKQGKVPLEEVLRIASEFD